MKDERIIELYVGRLDGTWDKVNIEVIDDDWLPIGELVYVYMKEHKDEFKDMVFYSICHIHDREE